MAFSMLLLLAPLASAFLRGHNGKPLIGMINNFRCEMCSHQCPDSKAYPKCEKFMTKMCNPGPDGKIDGSPGERTSGDGYCTTFFNVWYETCHPEASGLGHTSASGLGPAPAPGPAMLKAQPHPKKMMHLERKEVQALTHLDEAMIFGERGDPEYLSTKELDSLDADEITEEEEQVEPMMPKASPVIRAHVKVQGPLPFAFEKMFIDEIIRIRPNCRARLIKFEAATKLNKGVRKLNFFAPQLVVDDIYEQIVDPHSKLVNGPLRQFFVMRSHFQKVSEEEHQWHMH